MDLERFTRQMADNAERIRVLVEGVSDEQTRWKPDADSWSILEIVNHLYDEEREDFRVRLDVILHAPEAEWPPIDPQGWVLERNYNERDLVSSLDNFLRERSRSREWLRELSAPDWDAAYEASFGVIRAGDIFASWVAHDQLHMRQLVELHRAYTVGRLAPYEVDYAGPW